MTKIFIYVYDVYVHTSKEDIVNDTYYDEASRELVKTSNHIHYNKSIVNGKYHLDPRQQEEENKIKDTDPVVLGEGSFAKVFSYRDSDIAVKKITGDPACTFVTELSAYRLLKDSTGITKVKRYSIHGDGCDIHMERLQDVHDNIINGGFKGQEKSIIYGLLKTMYNAHSKGLLHLDLKPYNLLSRNGDVVISDWGSSVFSPFIQYNEREICTISYRAPEIFLGLPYNSTADIYSLGVILYELYYSTLNTLYEINNTRKKLYIDVINNDKILHPLHFTSLCNILYCIDRLSDIDNLVVQKTYLNDIDELSGKLLSMQMTCNLPSTRPTIAEALNHPYFDDIRGDEEFKEITRESILNSLPKLDKSGGDLDLIMAHILFHWLSQVCRGGGISMLAYFLALRYSNMIKGVTKQNFQYIGCACLKIATILTNEDISKFKLANLSLTKVETINQEIINVLKSVDFNLYGTIPFMFQENKDKETLKTLLEDEIFYNKEKTTILNTTRFEETLDIVSKLPFKPFSSITSRDYTYNKEFLSKAYNTLYYKKHNVYPEDSIEDTDIRKGYETIKERLN